MASGKNWQVGPTLKDKPGSQGTLFRGGTEHMSDARYPKGYTPERQAAVRAAASTNDWDRGEPHIAPAHRALVDNLARSTAPVEHMLGVQWAHAGPGQEVTSDGGSAGAYFKPNANRPDGLIGLKQGTAGTTTALHELGHHVSHTSETEHARNYSYSSAHGGHEEAFADNYATQHFRDRRGNAQPRGLYGGGEYAGRIERTPEFWSGYRDKRDWSHNQVNAREADKPYFKAHPEEEVHPGNTVQDPLVHQESTQHSLPDGGYRYTKELGDVNSDALPDGQTSHRDWRK